MAETVAAAVARVLEEYGVRHVFGVPGESFTPFLDALFDRPALDLVVARHEGGAAFMAEGYAQATGGLGVVLGARAVGAANMSIGIHAALENSTPLLALVGQVSSVQRGREGFQEIDVDRFLAPVCKHSEEVSDPRRVVPVLRRALALAHSGRPGPVAVSLPEDVFGEYAADAGPPPPDPARPRPSPAETDALLTLLSTARRPVLVAGGGVKRSGAESLLVRFAETFDLPVVTAWRRHDTFPNDHPLYAGHLQMGTSPAIVETLSAADVVVALGARLNEITTQAYTAVSAEARIVQVDVEPSMLGKAYPLALGIVADAGEALTAALDRATTPPRFTAWASERHDAYEQATTVAPEPHQDRVDNRQVVRMLRDRLPDDAIVTNDAGNFAGWLHTFYRFRRPGTYVGTASGAMGYALPAAMGARLAAPDATVLAVAGDGGFMMTVQELETAVRLRLPVVVLVFNNNMYGSIRMHQEKAFPGRVIGSSLGNPDFVSLAESFGAFGARVTADADFPPVLDQALAERRPAVIEIVTDTEQISVSRTIEQVRTGR